MNKNYILKNSIFILLIIVALPTAYAGTGSQVFWTKNDPANLRNIQRSWYPAHYGIFTLQHAAMKNFLSGAPMENNDRLHSSLVIELPMPDGSFQRYSLVESPVMEPALANAYPMIQTYAGKGIDDVTATLRCDFTPFGFHAYVLSANGTLYIDPLDFGNPNRYIVYYKQDIPPQLYRMNCLLETTDEKSELNSEHSRLYQPTSFMSIGSELRTYRLALAADYEYTQYYGGTVAGALAGMVTSINRVNGVYERELDIHMNLVANDTLLIYTTTSDPYTNNNGGTMLTQNQTTCNTVIGSANYDIGHVFSTGGGGVANLGCVCGNSKAKGVTGSPDPIGDPFDIDYVVHEMGHQFGANHSFNATTGSCGGGNRAASAAYEPGSASTIMGYAGICGTNDLQPHSDAYFHTKNFDEIVAYSQTGNGNTCPVITSTGNNPPVLTVPTTSFTIPYLSPFKLAASATDPDGDTVTFCWEEYDLGPAGNWNAPSGNAPIFRSFNATTSPERMFPKLTDILNNTTTVGEIKASYARSLAFRCTARDNRSMGGGVTHSQSTVNLNVINTGTPFAVTYPNTTGISWSAFAAETITWDVAQTDTAPINTPTVNIYLSTDNGQTFPVVIATGVPNNGSYSFSVPAAPTTTGRILVEGAGNIFLDINDQPFTIITNVGITEAGISNNVNVFPNPSRNEVHVAIHSASTGKCCIRITDLPGRIIKTFTYDKKAGVFDESLDLSGVSNGIYVLWFELPEGVTEKKLVKE